MKKMRRSLAGAEAFEGGVQPSGAVIFLSVFGQPVATHRRTRLEGVLAVLGEIRGGGPVWDVESGGTVCVLVADCQRPQSRARLKPETMTVTFEEFSPTHDFFDYTGSCSPSSDSVEIASSVCVGRRRGSRSRRDSSIMRAIQRFIRFCIDSKGTAGLCQTVCGGFLCSYLVGENARQIPGATTPHRTERPPDRCTWLDLRARKC